MTVIAVVLKVRITNSHPLLLLHKIHLNNSNTLGKEKKYIENLKKLLYHQYLIGSKV